MILQPNTPTKARVVQGEHYPEDFAFKMPRPFNESNVGPLADALGLNPTGLANQMNQVLAENLGNNLAAKIKAAVKHNAENPDDPRELPTQEDLDALIESYDFSGIRATSPAAEATMSGLDRIIAQYCRTAIRGILKDHGFAGMPGPVKVAKKDAEPGPNEISYEEFEGLVIDMAEGNGVWGESEAHAAARANLLELAESEYATRQKAAQSAARSLSIE